MPKADTIQIDCDDLLSKRGARLLAEAITKFWHDRGHLLVTAEAYPLADSNAFGVRSNLVNGLPPNHPALRA